jgi:DNA-binding transcriptional regulator of glucitol operon
MAIWFWLVVAVVAGWMVQLYMTYRQATAFNGEVRTLRKSGAVSVGVGGRRYRGGRAYVAIAIDDADVVRDAITLQGFTTFARARALPALRGQCLGRLDGDADVPELSRKQREAARQAASLYLEGRGPRSDNGPEGGITGTTG